MKKFLLLSLLFMTIVSFSQTQEAEVQFLKRKYNSGEITPEEYKKMGEEWSRIIEKYNGYPKFPTNEQTNEIEFIFIDTLNGFSKQDIFNRIMEFSAINFGNLSEALHYQNLETGKIILKGYFIDYYMTDAGWLFEPNKELPSKVKIDFTFQYTIQDGKMKTNVIDVQVETFYYGDYKYKTPLSSLYPITHFRFKEWEDKLKLLITIRNRIIGFNIYQVNYILNQPDDYNF